MNISFHPDGIITAYLRACGALWQVCYGEDYPVQEDACAHATINGARYEIALVASGARHLRFAITTQDGDDETRGLLEAQLICAYLASPPSRNCIPLSRRRDKLLQPQSGT